MVEFSRPVGARPGTNEIKYICALHQSGETIRSDGSINNEDIQVYLLSRFGIKVSLEEVQTIIMDGMGGSSNDDEVLDLMEVTAIILIPLLLKAAYVEGSYADGENNNNINNNNSDSGSKTLPPGVLPPPSDLLADCANIIIHDVAKKNSNKSSIEFGTTAAVAAAAASSEIMITTEFVKNILLLYGEDELANNQTLLEEMVQACSIGDNNNVLADDDDTSTKIFDAKSFGRGLTSDVRLYDLRNETRQSSIIEDIFSNHGCENSDSNKTSEESTTSSLDVRLGATEEEANQNRSITITTNGNNVQRIYTAPAIDMIAGTYRSKALIVILWLSTVFGLFSLACTRNPFALENIKAECRELYGEQGSITDNVDGILCSVGVSILILLLIFGMFCFLGVTIIGLGNIGNYNMQESRWYLPLIGCVAIGLVPFNLFLNPNLITPGAEISLDEGEFRYTRLTAVALLCITIYLHITHIVTLWFKNVDFNKSKWWGRLGFGSEKFDLHIKQAAAYKLNTLVTNARDIHRRVSTNKVFVTYFGRGLSTYALHGTQYVKTGGLFWFWRRVHNQTIFYKEGIFYSARLIASNLSQCFISIFIVVFGAKIFIDIVDIYAAAAARSETSSTLGNFLVARLDASWNEKSNIDALSFVYSFMKNLNATGILEAYCEDVVMDGQQEILDSICEFDTSGNVTCSNLESAEATCILLENPTLNVDNPNLRDALLEASGLERIVTNFRNSVSDTLSSFGRDMLPEKLWMVTIPLGIAIAFAFYTAMRNTLMYIPSVTATIIELRTGVIPSLRDPDFEKYRKKPDTITLLTGALFWGCFISSLLSGAIMGFIVFLFLWQQTSYGAFQFLIVGVGFIFFLILRKIFGRCCSVHFFKGLYRKNPAGANIGFLALEWANYFFTVFVIVVRMIKLMIVSSASLGMIDRPFLAKGIGKLGKMSLDSLPTIHTTDILIHEAHRHPYIEMLGLVYLMKFRYAENFCHRAGSTWRLILIYALMPWLHKYRIRDNTCDSDSDSVYDENSKLSLRPSVVDSSLDLPLSTSPISSNEETKKVKVKEIEEEISRLKEILRVNKLGLQN